MFKELFQLIKMLFKGKPKDVQNVELMAMKHFPFSSYLFMSWCGKMIYRKGKEDKILALLKTPKGDDSRRHETIHLRQAQYHHNSWVGYYWRYFIEWLKGNPIINPSSSAYYTIPYEVEAYALEEVKGSEENYNKELLKAKYNLKNRKKIYKQCGGSFGFKKYIKEL